MKKKIYLALIVVGLISFLGSCRGFKSAPPCPAYSSVEMPVSQSQAI
jgi:hypothetical protein